MLSNKKYIFSHTLHTNPHSPFFLLWKGKVAPYETDAASLKDIQAKISSFDRTNVFLIPKLQKLQTIYFNCQSYKCELKNVTFMVK